MVACAHGIAGQRRGQSDGAGGHCRRRIRIGEKDIRRERLLVIRERDEARRRVERAGHGERRRKGTAANRCQDKISDRVDREPLVTGRAQEALPADTRLGELERVDERVCRGSAGDEVVGDPPLELRIERSGPHVSGGVEQLDHGVERRARLVDVDPHLGSGVAREAVDVDIGGVVGRDVAMDLEAQPTHVITALFLRRIEGVGARREVRGQHPEPLRRPRRRVGIDPLRGGLLHLLHDRHVAVVRHRQELEAPPIARGRRRRRSVVVRVLDRQAERVEAGTDRVVVERREDHGVARLPHHLHRAADPVVDVEAVACGREAGVRTKKFHDQARVRLAHEPHACVGVQILDDDLRAKHGDDVDVVPDALDDEFLAPHLHAARCAAGRPARRRIDRVGDRVVADERPAVVVKAGVAVDRATGPARIGQLGIGERIGVDAHDRPEVVAEIVAEDHRLGPADEHGRRRVGSAAVSRAGRGAGRVVLDPAVRQPQVALVNLDHVEVVEAALDRGLAAAIGDVCVVDAGLRTDVEHDASPVTGIPRVGQVAVRVERAARAEPIVAEAREDHPLARGALRYELRHAPLELDPSALEFHDHARIDREPAATAGEVLGNAIRRVDFSLVAADTAVDEQIVLEDIDDVGAPEPGGNVEFVGLAAECRADLDEQTVDRVGEEPVALELGTDPAVRLLKAVGAGGNRRSGAPLDRVEHERRPRGLERDGRERVGLGIDANLPAAEVDGGLRDRVYECLLGAGVGVLAQHDAAPLAGIALALRPIESGGADAVRIPADRVVVVRRERDVLVGRAQHLDRRAGAVHQRRRTADVDVRGSELEYGPGVDHHRHALRDVEGGAVRKRLAGERRADEVGRVLVVADDTDDLRGRRDGGESVVDLDERERCRSAAEHEGG